MRKPELDSSTPEFTFLHLQARDQGPLWPSL